MSYPTIRLRLDRLIERIRILEEVQVADPFHARIRLLVADGELSSKLAKESLELHRTAAKGGRK